MSFISNLVAGEIGGSITDDIVKRLQIFDHLTKYFAVDAVDDGYLIYNCEINWQDKRKTLVLKKREMTRKKVPRGILYPIERELFKEYQDIMLSYIGTSFNRPRYRVFHAKNIFEKLLKLSNKGFLNKKVNIDNHEITLSDKLIDVFNEYYDLVILQDEKEIEDMECIKLSGDLKQHTCLSKLGYETYKNIDLKKDTYIKIRK